jgi:hypothetical protein
MQVILRAMRPDEWATFETRAMEGYARSLAAPEGSSPSAARQRAEAEHALLLPDGIDSPNHSFYVIEAPDGQRLGTIWLAEQVEAGTRYAYLYDIEVDEKARGTASVRPPCWRSKPRRASGVCRGST